MVRCRSKARTVFLAIAVAVSVVANRPLGAQEPATILGQVRDSSGGVLPGVAVTATSPAMPVGEMTAVTNENGEYRISPLPIGVYQVSYSLQGFGVKRHEVRLTTGFVAKIDVTLEVGSLDETITVSGASPIVDVTSTSTSTHLTREVLENIPTARSGINSLMALAPGARPLLDVGGNLALAVPTFRAFGQTGESWQSLEGVTSSQPRANTALGNYFDFAVVEEGSVKSVGANADMPFRGIQLDQVVRSGSDAYRGSLYGTWSNNSLVSSNLTSDLQSQGFRQSPRLQIRRDLTADFGGKVVPRRVWIYAAITRNEHRADVLDCFQEDGTTPCYRDQDGGYQTVKGTYQMTEGTRIIGFSQFGKKQDLTGTSAISPWSTRWQQNHNMYTGKVEAQSVIGKSLVTSVQLGRFSYEGPYDNFDGGQQTIETTTNVRTGGYFGQTATGNNGGGYTWHPRGTVTLYKPDFLYGNHEFKAGFDAVYYDLNRIGVSYTVKDPDQGIHFPLNDYQLRFTNGVPSQITIRNAPVDPHTKSEWLGTYVQDNWVIGRQLTVNLGLRFARDNSFSPEQCREASLQFPTLFPAACYDKVQFKIHNNLAPRIHASWDVGGDGRTVVKGGWSRFNQRRSLEPEVAAATELQQDWTFRWNDRNGNRLYDAGEVLLDKNGADFISTTPLVNGVPNPGNLRQPKSDEFMLSTERQLGSNTAARLTGIYSRNSDNKILDNPLRPSGVYTILVSNPDPGPDGVASTTDDPGTTISYYDYPTAYRGARFEQQFAVNSSALNSSFVSYEAAISRRMANRFMYQASFTSTKTDVPVAFNPGTTTATAVPSLNPNAFYNTGDNGTEWTAKLNGAYQFPWGITYSALYEARSGAYWARTALVRGGTSVPQFTVNAESPNERQLPTVAHLDMRVDKRFQLWNGHSLSVRFNVYNALNESTVLTVNPVSGPQFGRPVTILNARMVDIGGTFTW
jgi:hypothetical protein